MVGAIARTDLFGPHLATHLAPTLDPRRPLPGVPGGASVRAGEGYWRK